MERDGTDILITRLVDGEASRADRDRFERVAAVDPTLWRDLALRQVEMTLLAQGVEPLLEAAGSVELPERASLFGRVSWTLALSGWAAVLVIGLFWGMTVLDAGRRPGPSPAIQATPIEHYQRYLLAPFVVGELQPVVVEVEELPDGRVAVHFIRRIEEVAFLDPTRELPVDDEGELTSDIERLRGSEPKFSIDPLRQ